MAEWNGPNNLDSLKNNKKLRVFLLFLLLSFLFWILIKLSREYISEVEFEIAYTDIPNNKLIQNEPEHKLNLTLKTIGFKLLNYGFKEKVLEYSLDEIERKKGSLYYSVTKSNMNFLQAQLSAETVVLNIEPDTLFIDLGVKRSKKVAVVSDVDFAFKTGYNFIQPFEISPAEITISGPEKLIDSIQEVHTFKHRMSDISETFEEKTGLLIEIIEENRLENLILIGKIIPFGASEYEFIPLISLRKIQE